MHARRDLPGLFAVPGAETGKRVALVFALVLMALWRGVADFTAAYPPGRTTRAPKTRPKRAAYFAALVECGQSVEASRRVGLAYKTILRWCERDSEFEAACRAAYRLHYARGGGGDWTAFEKFQAVQEARARGVIS